MRELLIDMNQDMMKRNPNYIVRITSDDRVGKALLDDFIDPYAKYPVIATTSDLLTTGVDCKTCALIVIDKEVGSDTTFKQMIGRATRIFEKKDKMSLMVMPMKMRTTRNAGKKNQAMVMALVVMEAMALVEMEAMSLRSTM